MESEPEHQEQRWTKEKYPLYVDVSTTFPAPLQQLLSLVESGLRSIHGKDGSLSLTVSTDTGTLSVDMNSKSKASLLAGKTPVPEYWKQPQLPGMPSHDSNSYCGKLGEPLDLDNGEDTNQRQTIENLLANNRYHKKR